MVLLFHRLHLRYGDRRGYRIAMVSYWLLCAAAPLAVAGPRRLAGLVRTPRGALPRPRRLAVAALAVPPAGALLTELAPQLPRVTRRTLAAAVTVGITNAVAEEMFWRGLPVAMFPDDPVRGWVLPAAGFTVWHLAPLSVRRHPRGRYPILAGAAMIGAGAGWIAWSTGSLRAVLVPHAVTDSCGVRAARAVWTGSR